ncbi:hypothetical protein FB451DRAFT_1192413 [Mycena latifolia]|nr:hypothetical protein FB451DRAFT_1192413 [Mycena latifolia]
MSSTLSCIQMLHQVKSFSGFGPPTADNPPPNNSQSSSHPLGPPPPLPPRPGRPPPPIPGNKPAAPTRSLQNYPELKYPPGHENNIDMVNDRKNVPALHSTSSAASFPNPTLHTLGALAGPPDTPTLPVDTPTSASPSYQWPRGNVKLECTVGQEPAGWNDEGWKWRSSGGRRTGVPKEAFKVDKRNGGFGWELTPTPGISACKPFCWLGKPLCRLGTTQKITFSRGLSGSPALPELPLRGHATKFGCLPQHREFLASDSVVSSKVFMKPPYLDYS